MTFEQFADAAAKELRALNQNLERLNQNLERIASAGERDPESPLAAAARFVVDSYEGRRTPPRRSRR